LLGVAWTGCAQDAASPNADDAPPAAAQSGAATASNPATAASAAPSSRGAMDITTVNAPTAGADVAATAAQAPAHGPEFPDAESDAGQTTDLTTSSDAAVQDDSCTDSASSASKPGYLGDWTAGTYPSDFRDAAGGNYLTIPGLPNQNGIDREYAVHVPPSYDPAVPTPLLYCLHAFSMNALSFCDGMAGWLDKADKEGFIVVMPNGYMNSYNIGPGCGAALIAAYADGIDDVAFIRKLYDEVGTHLNIDLGRVYSTGFSNGAALSWRLACEASDIFTAFASGAGNVCLDSCEPAHPVSMLDIHGTGDILSPPETHPPSIEALTAVNGCATESEPASMPMSSGASTCVTWAGCPTGCSDVEVTECTVQGGSHCWYGDVSAANCGAGSADSDQFATNMAWSFLSRFSR